MLRRRDVLHLLMLGGALCPAAAWRDGVAWVAEVGDPMIHLFCQLLGAGLTLSGRRSGLAVYLLLAPFAAWDLLTAFFSGLNVPWTQIAYVPLVAATAAWGWIAVPDDYFTAD